MKFPEGKVHGLWAAFWLLSPESPNGHTEIDILEWYGSDPKGHHQTVHVWPKDRKAHAYQSNYDGTPAMTDGGWHTYGAMMRAGIVYIYMDRKEISRVSVPGEFKTSYYAVVTLAVLKKEAETAESPFSIAVDYIRAYGPARMDSQ
jgi:beta-glucanase (GH16 family)